MSAKFIAVPRPALESPLLKAGFTPRIDGAELAFNLKHKLDPKLSVHVLTSIPYLGTKARKVGTDAIRIMALEEIPSAGRRKRKLWGARVNRCGTVAAVVERTLERAREAYKVLSKRVLDKGEKWTPEKAMRWGYGVTRARAEAWLVRNPQHPLRSHVYEGMLQRQRAYEAQRNAHQKRGQDPHFPAGG